MTTPTQAAVIQPYDSFLYRQVWEITARQIEDGVSYIKDMRDTGMFIRVEDIDKLDMEPYKDKYQTSALSTSLTSSDKRITLPLFPFSR
jgi:hypothetical protein